MEAALQKSEHLKRIIIKHRLKTAMLFACGQSNNKMLQSRKKCDKKLVG